MAYGMACSFFVKQIPFVVIWFLCYRHEIEVHNLSFDNGTDTRDSIGYFYCRARCGEVFKTKTTRNRHVLKFLWIDEVLNLLNHMQ